MVIAIDAVLAGKTYICEEIGGLAAYAGTGC